MTSVRERYEPGPMRAFFMGLRPPTSHLAATARSSVSARLPWRGCRCAAQGTQLALEIAALAIVAIAALGHVAGIAIGVLLHIRQRRAEDRENWRTRW